MKQNKLIFCITFILFFTMGTDLIAEDIKNSEKLIPITEEELFFCDYLKHINLTQKKLTLMNKKNNLSKLGNEKITGNISGTLSYSAKIMGIGGLVTIHYDNYSDEEGWIFNGDIITNANLSENGKFSGQITVQGKYNASVIYDKAILKNGKAGGGSYIVQLSGKQSVELPYLWYFVE